MENGDSIIYFSVLHLIFYVYNRENNGVILLYPKLNYSQPLNIIEPENMIKRLSLARM